MTRSSCTSVPPGLQASASAILRGRKDPPWISFVPSRGRTGAANPAASSAIGSSASVAESHLCEFAAKSVGFRRVGGLLESAREFEEGRPSIFVSGDGIAKEIGESAVTAHIPGDGNRIDLRSHISRNRNVDSLNARGGDGHTISEYTDFSPGNRLLHGGLSKGIEAK